MTDFAPTSDATVDNATTATAVDDAIVPFVLGGRLRWTWRGATAVVALLAFAMLPVRGLFRSPGSSMEEGFMLVFPRLVQQGEVPNVDFLHLYGPGSLDVLAGWYRIFGYTLEAERAFGLLQNLGIILALYALTRPWGRIAAVGAGVVAALLTMTPIGLAALAWHGAIALALWATVFAIRARHTGAPSSWAVAGLLGGVALSFRPDIVIAVSLTFVVAGWVHRRVALRPVLLGACVGLIPMWIQLVVAGPGPVFQGIVVDPVVNLRPGRELPSPPSFGHIDGALQAIAEAVPPYWPIPAPAARHQLFFWFFAVVLIAIAVPAGAWWIRRRSGANPQIDALLIAGVFGFGILPQALQRPDSTHLAWVAMVSWPLSAALITHAVSRRVGRAAVASGAVAVLALMLVVSPFYTYRYYLLQTRVSVGDLPLPFLVQREDRKFWFGNPEVANALLAMIPDLEARSEPGDRLVVGTADLSRTVYSDVSIYYLFDELQPATYYIEMDPGLADTAGSGLADDIDGADFVVLTNFWSGWLEPNTSVQRQSQEANRAVADNFCLVGQYESNLLMLFERCPGGGGISGADVDGLYPVVPVPEELAGSARRPAPLTERHDP